MSDAYAPKIDFKNKQTVCHVHQGSNIQQTQLYALFADFIHDNDLQWAVQMFDRHPNIYDGGYSITSPKIIGKMSERAP